MELQIRLDKNKVTTERIAAGIDTQKELAAIVGVSPEQVCRWIKPGGKEQPSMRALTALCNILGCEIDDLMTYTRG